MVDECRALAAALGGPFAENAFTRLFRAAAVVLVSIGISRDILHVPAENTTSDNLAEPDAASTKDGDCA